MTYCRTSILNFYSPILPEIGVLTIKEAEGLLYLFPHLPKSTLPPTMQFVVVAPALLIDSGSLPSPIITTIHVSLLMTLVHSFSPNGISTNGISLGTYWLYLLFGVVHAPGERLEQRKLRQEMGETLISWADEYFSSNEHLNQRLVRKDLYDAFCTYDPAQRKFISPTAFKKKFIMYCDWKGYIFNPHKYDSKTGKPFQLDKDGRPIIDDKAGGIEYFTVGTGSYTGDGIPEDDSTNEQTLIDF